MTSVYLETRKDRRGVWGGPGRGRLIGSTVAQLVLVVVQDLLVGARLCSVCRHRQLHFSFVPWRPLLRTSDAAATTAADLENDEDDDDELSSVWRAASDEHRVSAGIAQPRLRFLVLSLALALLRYSSFPLVLPASLSFSLERKRSRWTDCGRRRVKNELPSLSPSQTAVRVWIYIERGCLSRSP